MKPKDSSAPGSLETLRLFVNSTDLEDPGKDELADRRRATSWLHAHDLLPDYDHLDDDEREMLVGLREAFRMELLSHTGDADPATTWDVLSGYADQAELGIRLGALGDVSLIAEGRGAQRVAGRLFTLMYDGIRMGQWTRLKACRKQTCLFGFYDHSKNGSGVWCDMAVCGNRVKAQRRRRREAAVS